MAARKFLELKTNFFKHATIQSMAMSRSEWKQTAYVVADCQSQHHSTGCTFGYGIGEKRQDIVMMYLFLLNTEYLLSKSLLEMKINGITPLKNAAQKKTCSCLCLYFILVSVLCFLPQEIFSHSFAFCFSYEF